MNAVWNPPPEDFYLPLIEQVTASLPRFANDPERIDYTGAAVAVVINCIVEHDGEILLLQRSSKVGDHHGLWAGVSGYYDRLLPVSQVVHAELEEELGLTAEDVKRVAVARPYLSPEPAVGRCWITFAALAQARTRDVRLNWENDQSRWVHPRELLHIPLIPGQLRIVSDALALLGSSQAPDEKQRRSSTQAASTGKLDDLD